MNQDERVNDHSIKIATLEAFVSDFNRRIDSYHHDVKQRDIDLKGQIKDNGEHIILKVKDLLAGEIKQLVVGLNNQMKLDRDGCEAKMQLLKKEIDVLDKKQSRAFSYGAGIATACSVGMAIIIKAWDKIFN